MHAHSIKWNAGISYPHSRACPMIGSFLLRFTYCDNRVRDRDSNIIFRCSFIGYFFSGVLYCDNRDRVSVFAYDTKWGTSKHAPLYKSDCLIFRCSFYYVSTISISLSNIIKVLVLQSFTNKYGKMLEK
jgi:hypothetical protein